MNRHDTNFDERFAEGPQGKLFTSMSLRTGKSTPILFVHSDGGTLHHWDSIRAKLNADFSTVAFDRRGHGQSDAPRNHAFAAADAANDVAAVADATQIEHFVLVGHSGGGTTAFAFAGLYPQRLSGLVLVDPPPDPAVLPPGMIEETLKALRGEDYAATVEKYFRSIAGNDKCVADRIVADALATPRETIIGLFEATKSFDPKRYAGQIQCPSLSIIQSQYDVEGALHRIPPGFPHVAIDGVGHWIHLVKPEQFLSSLQDFLKQVTTERVQ